MSLFIADPTPVKPERPRTYLVTYTNGADEIYEGITRSVLGLAVLSLYRRERPSDAEQHVASLPLANVRKWVRRDSGGGA